MEYLSEERRRVIENIRAALAEGDLFRKVEISDPAVSDEMVRRVILPMDIERRRPLSRIKAFIARLLAEKLTADVNGLTDIIGLENVISIEGGAIITANHYNPTDSTPIRMMTYAIGKHKKHDIIVQETNVFMTGLFGFLMKNCNTLPTSRNREYMAKRLTPTIEKKLSEGRLILIYPEQEMWYNYKKPRDLRDGAYHWAAVNGVPVIPTFTEMRTKEGERDENGFLPIKHVLHILPPIYPDKNLTPRENRVIMRERDLELKRELYERLYGIPLDNSFIPERDIAGLVAD